MAHVAAEWTVHPFHFGSMRDCVVIACKEFLANGGTPDDFGNLEKT